jgi:quercetin 2,3-dioxygenase
MEKGGPVERTLLTPGVDVRRAGERFATRIGWLDSQHSFSFGHHYDPRNTGFGLLLVSNDDVVAPGTGFETHPHRDMEIVTWVLDGGLVHQDSEGHNGLIYPGLAQRMSAGTGILHSEKHDSTRRDAGSETDGAFARADVATDRPVHFVQMWVVPDESGIRPGYEQLDITAELTRGGLVPVASGRPEHRDSSAIRISQRHAALFAARLAPGESVALPSAPYVHLYVARGSVQLEGAGDLATGDAARVTLAGGQRVTARDDAEVLVWEMHAELG